MTGKSHVGGIRLAFPIFAMLAVSSNLLPVTVNAAENGHAPVTTSEADARIDSLLNKIETTLVEQTNAISDREVAEMLVEARALSPRASANGQGLLQEFSARLNRRAAEERDAVRYVNFKVFADVAANYLNEKAPEPGKGPVPTEPPSSALNQPPVLRQRPPAPQQRTLVQGDPVRVTPEPPPLSVRPSPSPAVPSSMQRALINRGDSMLDLGDVSAARLLYQRAAETVGLAALKLGNTYDINFLAARNLRGIKPDPAEAEKWYRKAAALGEPRAVEWVKRHDGNSVANVLGRRE